MRRKARPGKVIGVGLSTLDLLLLWEDTARPVAENRILDCTYDGGGLVATALVAAARLGAQAEYWGTVGDDWMADMILEGLAAEHVDTAGVRRIPGARGPLVVVCVDGATGERRFLYWTGSLRAEEPLGDLGRLGSAGCLLVDFSQPVASLAAAQRARELGVPVVADVSNWLPEERREVMRYVDHAIASEGLVAGVGAGDVRAACEALRALGPRHAAVTLGARGVASLDDEGWREVPAFEVEVVDTTGAGDTFHGAFCCGVLRGYDVETNLRFSAAVAALKCRRLGGRAGIPTFEEVAAFMRERGAPLLDAG